MANDTTDPPLTLVNQIDDPAEAIFLTEQKKHEEGKKDKQLDVVESGCNQGGVGHVLGLERQSSENQSNSLEAAADLLGLEEDAKKTTLEGKEESCPLLDFPVTISIEDIPPTFDSEMSHQSMDITRGIASSVSRIIERNKSLCSVTGGKKLLTVEEEERVSQLLLEDEDGEKFGCMPLTEEERDVELNGLLRGLGYDIENGAEDSTKETEGSQGAETSNPRGDPVLRELAKSRELLQHQQSVDRALCALLSEPLPPVVRFPEDGIPGEEEVSLLSSICGEAAMTEAELKQLVQRTKKELEDEQLQLADHQSIRMLAQSIFDDESSKKSSHDSIHLSSIPPMW